MLVYKSKVKAAEASAALIALLFLIYYLQQFHAFTAYLAIGTIRDAYTTEPLPAYEHFPNLALVVLFNPIERGNVYSAVDVVSWSSIIGQYISTP